MDQLYEYLSSTVFLASTAVVVAVLVILYRIAVSPYQVLASYGIKGPRPLPLVGNYLSVRKNGRKHFVKEQIKVFGPVFGFYLGARPKIVITDVELAKEIMVKEFDKFTNRGMSGVANLNFEALGIQPGLLVAVGETWRTGRHALTPSFSGLKMKLMEPLLKRSSDILVEKMGEFAETGRCVEVFRVYGMFTLETLIATAFGRYINIQRGEGDTLTEAARVIFGSIQEGSAQSPDVLITIISTFPWITPLLKTYIRQSHLARSTMLIHKTGVELINARIRSKQSPKVKDLLQLMIDATDEENDSAKKLTSEQIASFSRTFLLAGYETTANTLSYITYLLATYPDVQEKLQTEIDQYFEENPESSLYEAAQKMKYLEMVIHECMRLYTTVPNTQRYCSETVKIGDVTIPEGVDVIFPIDVIHHMSQYWPDPYKFDPERFTPEAKANRPQLAHMPFGWGPRNCIGLRFALLEIKIVLIEILRKYSFACGPETVANLEQITGITLSPKGGVHVKIIQRF